MAIALSGYPHERFVFEGFIPVKDPARAESLKLIASEARPVVLMETPYRLSKLLSELDQYLGSREICLAVELGMSTEEVLRGSAKQLVQKFDGQKRPFVAVVSPKF
ncbi:MAG: hypothetical protein CME71_09435 [Halobacteriovorax sp.]|nr:hypothetical protein [Halobacteriovorax sp.]